jgi:hypothetical protein
MPTLPFWGSKYHTGQSRLVTLHSGPRLQKLCCITNNPTKIAPQKFREELLSFDTTRTAQKMKTIGKDTQTTWRSRKSP